MGLEDPPADLGKRRLRLVWMPETVVRISRAGYRDPFFWSRLGRNRFDLPDGRYGVLYAAQDLETCVLEVFGDRWLKERVMSAAALPKFVVLTFAAGRELRVADLTGPALDRLGTDANLFAANDYAVTQEWSRQLMNHAPARDGMRYHSRKIHGNTIMRFMIPHSQRRASGCWSVVLSARFQNFTPFSTNTRLPSLDKGRFGG
jgi:hypothetical protein